LEAEQILRENDLKVTPQRKAIIAALINADTVMSPQELFQEVLKILPGTNFSTIYRNLDKLLSHKIICKVLSEKGVVMYELKRKDGHHHHIICKGCGKALAVDFCPLDNEILEELNNKGFTLTEHRFEVYGYCKECKD
jgi:Fe2+ or Zn2+ uptake regulation protein